jgi:CIC family chloride channel protein
VSPPPPREQLRLREHQLFIVLSVVIGVLAGLAAVLFALAIEAANRLLFGFNPQPARLFAVPAIVSVGTGILLSKVFPGVRGSGVPQTKAAFHLAGGRIPQRVPVGKFITGVLCIGSGHSMGREGPSVQIGAGIASNIGRWFHLSPQRVRALVPIGAAGALAAAFNTPISAVIFALEEIIGDLNATVLGSTVVASIASVVVMRAILGNEPLFHVPAYHLVHPAELAAYAVLGVAGGIASLVFTRGLLALRALFLRLPERSQVLQPAIGGVAIGLLLLVAPAVKGVGYESVDQALNGGLVLRSMLALCLLKILATILSYASGNAGGIFAPSLFIGAMAGGVVGVAVQAVAPFPTGGPGAYALVGMGAAFAGIIRAPMTSVFMIFEITQDYQIIVPLMVANMLSFAISRRYQKQPVYDALMRQDGVHLPDAGLREKRGATARDLMRPAVVVAFLAPDVPIGVAREQVSPTGPETLLVGKPERLIGIVTRGQLGAADAAQLDLPVAALASAAPAHAHPDHSLDVILDRFGESGGLLPVVGRDDARRVEGIITLDDITHFARRRRASAAASSVRPRPGRDLPN